MLHGSRKIDKGIHAFCHGPKPFKLGFPAIVFASQLGESGTLVHVLANIQFFDQLVLVPDRTQQAQKRATPANDYRCMLATSWIVVMS